jgi:hypothetical protein
MRPEQSDPWGHIHGQELEQRSADKFYQRVPLPVPSKEMTATVVAEFTQTAEMMRNAKIDGNTDPKVAREAIKNEFMKIKTFKGIQSYVMRDTGDMHIPGRALVADTAKNEWRFADK